MAVRAIWVAAVLVTCAGAARAQAPGLPVTSAAEEVQSPAPAPASTVAPIKLTFGARPDSQSAAVPLSEPAARSGISPTYFWIAASATIITASLGGFEALHVRDLYDRAQGLPPVAPERARIHDQMRSAEATADLVLIGSLVLAVGTTILAFHIDWSGTERPPEQVGSLARALPPTAAGRRWW